MHINEVTKKRWTATVGASTVSGYPHREYPPPQAGAVRRTGAPEERPSDGTGEDGVAWAFAADIAAAG